MSRLDEFDAAMAHNCRKCGGMSTVDWRTRTCVRCGAKQRYAKTSVVHWVGLALAAFAICGLLFFGVVQHLDRGTNVTKEPSDRPSWWGRMLCVVNDPRENLQQWYEGLYGGVPTRCESLTSAATRPALRRGIDAVARFFEMESWDRETIDTMRALWPRFSLTELRYEIMDKSGDRAWVQVTGDLVMASGFGQDRVHLEDTVQMIKENGEWRFHCFERRFMSGFEKRLEEEIVGPGFLECR